MANSAARHCLGAGIRDGNALTASTASSPPSPLLVSMVSDVANFHIHILLTDGGTSFGGGGMELDIEDIYCRSESRGHCAPYSTEPPSTTIVCPVI